MEYAPPPPEPKPAEETIRMMVEEPSSSYKKTTAESNHLRGFGWPRVREDRAHGRANRGRGRDNICRRGR